MHTIIPTHKEAISSGPDVNLIGIPLFKKHSTFTDTQTEAFNHITAVNGGLLVRVFGDVAISSVAFDGQALTLVKTVNKTAFVAIYVGSDTANSLPIGIKNVVITYASSATGAGVFISNLEGLNQTTASNANSSAVGTANNTGTQSVTINEGGLCVSIVAVDSTTTFSVDASGQVLEDQQEGAFGINNGGISHNSSQTAGSKDSKWSWSISRDYAHAVGALDRQN